MCTNDGIKTHDGCRTWISTHVPVTFMFLIFSTFHPPMLNPLAHNVIPRNTVETIYEGVENPRESDGNVMKP